MVSKDLDCFNDNLIAFFLGVASGRAIRFNLLYGSPSQAPDNPYKRISAAIANADVT